jgi:hypothetical protein
MQSEMLLQTPELLQPHIDILSPTPSHLTTIPPCVSPQDITTKATVTCQVILANNALTHVLQCHDTLQSTLAEFGVLPEHFRVKVGFVDGHLNARQAVYLYCQSTINEDLSASLVNIFHPFPYTVIQVPKEGNYMTEMIPDMDPSILHHGGHHGHNKGKQCAEQPSQGSSSGDQSLGGAGTGEGQHSSDDTGNYNHTGGSSGGGNGSSGGDGTPNGDDGPQDNDGPSSHGDEHPRGKEDSDNLTWSGDFWSKVTCSEAKQPTGKLWNRIARLLNQPGVLDNSHDIQTFLTSVKIHLKVSVMLTPWYRCILTIA